MTDCPNADIRDLLPDLLHGRLEAGDRATVEAHLRDCADCRGELELLRGLRNAAPSPRVNVDAIAAAIPAYRRRRSWGSPGWRIAAAIIFLAVGGSTVATFVEHRDRVDSVATRVASTDDSALGASGDIELSVGYGYSDLTDAQLSALLKDVQNLNAVPLTEPDLSIPNVTVGNGGV
jgi:predicted anti-sigma-YlaC factor YlaD